MSGQPRHPDLTTKLRELFDPDRLWTNYGVDAAIIVCLYYLSLFGSDAVP